MPWRRKRQPTPVFLPEKFKGQRILRATVHGVTKEWVTTEHTGQEEMAEKLIVFSYLICL